SSVVVRPAHPQAGYSLSQMASAAANRSASLRLKPVNTPDPQQSVWCSPNVQSVSDRQLLSMGGSGGQLGHSPATARLVLAGGAGDGALPAEHPIVAANPAAASTATTRRGVHVASRDGFRKYMGGSSICPQQSRTEKEK